VLLELIVILSPWRTKISKIREQLVKTVLDRCARQSPTILALEVLASHAGSRFVVFNGMSLVKNNSIPLNFVEVAT
jgi:hypothetical protein